MKLLWKFFRYLIVRLGHQAAPKTGDDPFRQDIYLYIEEAYKMIANAS